MFQGQSFGYWFILQFFRESLLLIGIPCRVSWTVYRPPVFLVSAASHVMFWAWCVRHRSTFPCFCHTLGISLITKSFQYSTVLPKLEYIYIYVHNLKFLNHVVSPTPCSLIEEPIKGFRGVFLIFDLCKELIITVF